MTERERHARRFATPLDGYVRELLREAGWTARRAAEAPARTAERQVRRFTRDSKAPSSPSGPSAARTGS